MEEKKNPFAYKYPSFWFVTAQQPFLISVYYGLREKSRKYLPKDIKLW